MAVKYIFSRLRRAASNHQTLVAAATITCSLAFSPPVSAFTQSSFFSDNPIEVNTEKELRLDVAHEVQDLAYGEFLYDYFQEKYFSAITKALIADYRNQFTHHDEQVQVLVGSLFVGYGLLDEAERIFHDLLEYTTESKTRELIWYNLAELYYKRGNFSKSIDLLDTHFKVPSDNIHTQVSLLYALNLLAENKLELALEHLKRIKDTQNLSSYAYLNLGSVHSLLDQPQQAEQYFTELLRLRGKNNYVKGIKDRAALALGKHYLEAEDYKNAQRAFEKIRLEGAAANTGLLGLGWAHFKSDNPQAALTPWMELLKRSHTDRAVQEAYINIPYVYENLGALQSALDGYYKAESFYSEEQGRLAEIKAVINNSDWVDQLTPVVDFSFDPMDKIPDFQPPAETASLYLYKMFATNDFNEGYRNYRELQRLMQVLNHWHKQIPIFHQMISSHVERMDKLAPDAAAKLEQGMAVYEEVSKKLDAINDQLRNAIRNNDTKLTANEKQLALLDRIDALEKLVDELPDTREYQAEKERFRVIKGLLMWDLNSTAIERRWERMKDRIFIENQLADLERNIANVRSARSRRLERFQGFKDRIQDLEVRLQELFAACQYELLRHRVFLKDIALTQLDRRQAHVQQLQANAIYAIARLQDMAFSKHREQAIKMMGEPGALENGDTEMTEPATETGTSEEPRVDNKGNEEVEVPLNERKSLFDGTFKSWFDF